MLNLSTEKKTKKDIDTKVSSYPFLFSDNQKTCKDLFQKHDLTKSIHFWNESHFALHDLIIYFANRIGTVNVICSSFNLSVRAAKSIVAAYNAGAFFSFKLILNKQKAWSFKNAISLIENHVEIKLYKNHSKVACIWNDDFYCSIVYSGNLSNNKNLERGFIAFDKTIFNYDCQKLNEYFNRSN